MTTAQIPQPYSHDTKGFSLKIGRVKRLSLGGETHSLKIEFTNKSNAPATIDLSSFDEYNHPCATSIEVVAPHETARGYISIFKDTAYSLNYDIDIQSVNFKGNTPNYKQAMNEQDFDDYVV